jgi:hypothetical protein
MAQAEHEPTAPAAETHPVPSDAELVKLAFRRLHSLQDDMDAIGDFCSAIIVGLALEVEQHDQALGGAIHRIAREIQTRYEAVGEVHKELFFALNPNRHRPDLIPPILANDGNGEVEKSGGDAS